MTNLAGHDLEALLEAFTASPTITAPVRRYTIKGFGLPFACHKDNHAGLMNPDQMAEFRRQHHIGDGAEWDKYEGLTLTPPALDEFLAAVPFAAKGTRRFISPMVELPEQLPLAITPRMSTQEGFGRVLADLARIGGPLAERIVTTSPDVAVSTNLGGWVNRRGVFNRHRREDVFSEQKVVSAQRWQMTPAGQHIELGIAENNLFDPAGGVGLRTRCSARGCCPSARCTIPSFNVAWMRSTMPATRTRDSCWSRRRRAWRWRRRVGRTNRWARR
jgi:pyruvate dehydrogenase E1 component